MLVVLLILSAVAVGFVYYKKNNSNPIKNDQQKNNSAASQSGVEVIFQDIDEMVVNLDSKGKENNFLKLKITLEVSDKESLEVIKNDAKA